MRNMLVSPEFRQAIQNVPRPGAEEATMGPYFPHASYYSRESFEALGCAANDPAPALRLHVKPRRAVAGRRTRFTFKVRRAGRPVRGATVRFAGRTLRTRRGGRARVKLVLRRPGVRRVRAAKGTRRATGAVRVVRRR